VWCLLRTLGTILVATHGSVQENRRSGNHKRHPRPLRAAVNLTQPSIQMCRGKVSVGDNSDASGCFLRCLVCHLAPHHLRLHQQPSHNPQQDWRPDRTNRWNLTESRHGRGRSGEYSEKPTAGYSECCGEDISGTPEKGQRPICRYSNIRTKQSQT